MLLLSSFFFFGTKSGQEGVKGNIKPGLVFGKSDWLIRCID